MCICLGVNVFDLFACFCVRLPNTVCAFARTRTHQVVSVVVEASTAGGEKIKGRRKSMRGSDEKDEKEEMTRVRSADFAGLSLFCAPFYNQLVAATTLQLRALSILFQEQHSRKKKLTR